MPRIFARVVLLLALLVSLAVDLHAGGGPENVFLVINARDDDSITVANHYLHLRNIPTSNVFYLDYSGPAGTIDSVGLRDKILNPIFQAMKQRGIATHIDIIAYSTGFPTVVDYQKEARKPGASGPQAHPGFGSLTGMTYMWMAAAKQDWGAIENLTGNHYYRPVVQDKLVQPPHGFRSWYGWGNDGALQESGGDQYMLCTTLGYIGEPGNTLKEVLACLDRSAKADFTQPKGTFYFAKHSDIRATARAPQFAAAVAALKELGMQAEVITARVPRGKSDVLGAQLGEYDKSTIQGNLAEGGFRTVPGGIVDNLTSFGAVFSPNHRQPLLSDAIRIGAAGSCGTITEPGLITQKFPNAFLYYHYAQGCNLAEAFYQSLAMPYQTLVVGDPLCSPFAVPPKIELQESLPLGVQGKLKLTPKVAQSTDPVDRFELYIDGSRVARCGTNESLELDSALYSDGYHELRIVGVQDNNQEFQGRIIAPAAFDNHNRSIALTVNPQNRIRSGQDLKVKIECKGATSLILFANGRIVGNYPGDTVDTTIRSKRANGISLGSGPITLRAIGLGTGDATAHVLSAPLKVTITP